MTERAGLALDPAIAAPGVRLNKGSLAVVEVRVLTTEIVLRASNELFDLFELCGTRSGQASNAFRHWYNARVHTLHEPMHDKFTAVGDHLLNGVLPPLSKKF